MSSGYTDSFKGTAAWYARYRPGYPDAMIAHVIDRFGLDGSGRLLDLGCGTGQLLIPLAPHVETAIGMDPEPEMLNEAQRVAEAAGITNAVWIEGGSLDLERLHDQLAPLRLTTIGRAFHWMDGDATLSALGALTVPGGGVVQCGEPCEIWSGQRDWQVAVREVIQRWLGEERRAGSGTYAARSDRIPWSEGDLLARSPFSQVEFQEFAYTRRLDIDDVVGYLYSMSFASPAILGDRRPAFERDLRETLSALAGNGPFEEDHVLATYLAWKA
ncbi:MAG TPA: class I SAM-dependent methyltransferase [Thermomicrobiales bacterium]|nr:class I SAM-dependent methyltransferase [Thermomicrobiales bacterium]